MKKYTIITLALVLMMGIAPAVSRAEEGTSSNSGSGKWPFGVKKEVRERMEDRREKEMFEKKILENGGALPVELRDERREDRLKEIRENGLSTTSKKPGERFGHMKQIARKAHILNFKLEHLMTRFQARIDKLESMGVDVSKADAQMDVVESAIADAKAKIEALKAFTSSEDDEDDSSDDSSDDSDDDSDTEDTSQVETARNEAKEAVKKVHEEMKELITILRSYKVSSDSSASATTTTE